MKKIVLYSLALAFSMLTSGSSHAQTGKTEPEKKTTTTTIDVWREAAPSSEQPLVVTAEPNEASEATESSQQIEKKITGLEIKLAESLKMSDSPTLRKLLADDFVPVGRNIVESQIGKNGFIDWVLKNSEHKSLAVEKMKVRVYGTDTAIATVHYKKVAADGTMSADGGLIATDVWIKRGNFWQAASHHISQLPKP